MYTLKLSDSLFADIEVGDIFVYRYSENSYEIQEAEENYLEAIASYLIMYKDFNRYIVKEKISVYI